MPEPKPRLFLSYRRNDCVMHAGRLADNLRDRGVADVFIDLESIRPGENFVRRIEEEVASCDAFLIMIGDDWLELQGDDGRARIFNPDDWVHIEIKTALQRNVPLLPVLVEKVEMPAPDKLPEPLLRLAEQQGIELRESTWRSDVDRLIAVLPSPSSHSQAGSASPKSDRKELAGIDLVAAQAFIESIPPSRWCTHEEVALAGGSRTGGDAVREWLDPKRDTMVNADRVLSSTRPGPAAQHWSLDDAADAGVALVTPHEERSAHSSTPSDTLIVAARRAYPDYLLSSSYICQAGRSFRSGVERLGFYSERLIKPEVPQILLRRDNVTFSPEESAALRATAEEMDAALADLIDQVLDTSLPWTIPREPGDRNQVFLLSGRDDPRTLGLGDGISHDGRSAWTMGQRYADSAALSRAQSTADL